MSQYTADAASDYSIHDLDGLSAIYHRRSGVTHVVSDPVPQILATLFGQRLSAEGIIDVLARDYDLPHDAETGAALSARLDEMCEVGLVASV